MNFEEVSYRLAYYSDSASLEYAIVESISRLPEDVADFALDNCKFLSIGKVALGMTLPASIVGSVLSESREDSWVILLYEGITKKDIHGAVAHEIAHAWLKHNRLSPNCPKDCEIQAANLTKEWGFKGIGADAEYCDGVSRIMKRAFA